MPADKAIRASKIHGIATDPLPHEDLLKVDRFAVAALTGLMSRGTVFADHTRDALDAYSIARAVMDLRSRKDEFEETYLDRLRDEFTLAALPVVIVSAGKVPVKEMAASAYQYAAAAIQARSR